MIRSSRDKYLIFATFIIIGLISVGQWMSTFQVYLIHNNTLKNCRIRPTYNKVMDEEYLRMPENGWREIKPALLRESKFKCFQHLLNMRKINTNQAFLAY